MLPDKKRRSGGLVIVYLKYRGYKDLLKSLGLRKSSRKVFEEAES